MAVVKNFLATVLVVIICSFFTVTHAEEVDSYFVWEIKNFDDYQPYKLLFESMTRDNKNGVVGMRDMIYWATIYGKYSESALDCEVTEAQQKIAFGENYFDENLVELTAKLYLTADELDKAERKINFLLDNARDNSTKIRALNLKSDFYNRRGNYRGALTMTGEVAELLRSAPDEKLSLINLSRTARAYCGLGETQKSLELAEKIFPSMQNIFGKAGIETLALMSTLAEDYRKLQRHEDDQKILMNKLQVVNERYGQNDPVIVAKTYLELADASFATKDTKRGDEFSNFVLKLATQCADRNPFASLQLYSALKETATKNLGDSHPLVLKAQLGIAQIGNSVGDIPQSIELCKKNLPKFKKVFGEQGDETLTLMKILSDDYILLGNYSNAKKIVDERLTVCKKNFGEHHARTIESAIDSANLCYRTGKYKTADKLLANVENQSRDLLESDPQLQFNFFITKVTGARMKSAYSDMQPLSEKISSLPTKNFAQVMDYMLQLTKAGVVLASDSFGNMANKIFPVISLSKSFTKEYNPKRLEMLNLVAEAYIDPGELKTAENLTQQIFELSRKHFGENNFCEWMALHTLSKIRRAEGNFSDALAVDKQALRIAETVCGKNSLERLQSLDAIASDHAATGNFSEAIKIREQSLAEYKNILDGDESNSLRMMTNLAENYVAAKRYADAMKLCDETLAKQNTPIYDDEHISFNRDVLDLFRIKAQAQRLSGDNSGAMSNYVRLIQTYEIRRISFKDNFHNGENKSKWFAKIIDVYREAATVAETAGNTNFAFYCMEFCKGRNIIDRYDDILVAKNYLIGSDEKKSLAKYQKLLTTCKAFAESSTAKNNDMLRSSAGSVYEMLLMNIEVFESELRQKYSNNMVPKDPQKRAEAEQKPSQWEKSLKNFDVQKNRQIIPNGACFIDFLKVSDDLLLVVFLRNNGDVQASNIPVDKKFFDKSILYHDLNAYTDMIAMHGDGKYLWQVDGEYAITADRTKPTLSAVAINDNAKLNELRQGLSAELSQKLMPTIETYAGSSSHWIISPDAELNLLPFETLIFRNKMLIESVDVSYVPSLAVLNLMKKREQKNAYLGQSKELFAMGDAVYSDTDTATSRGTQLEFFNKLCSNPNEEIDITSLRWSNLPGTVRELDKVSPLFENKEIFRREQVTEKNLRKLNEDGELSKYKYLLFATHGLFIPDKPEISSIVLSQGFNDEETDGYVTVGEWMGYDLRSNLVYLSACESGLGGYQAGEGIVGIPYALTVAGNKDTVMSLWKVDDEATAEFTSAVFEKLSKGKSEVVALNETKREFLKNNNQKYRTPSFWAAFLLYGI